MFQLHYIASWKESGTFLETGYPKCRCKKAPESKVLLITDPSCTLSANGIIMLDDDTMSL